MKLRVITPDNCLFDETITSINIAQKTGGFSVLKGHAPIISILENFVLTINTTASQQFVAAHTGTLRVLKDDIILILDYGVIANSAKEARDQLNVKEQSITNERNNEDNTVANLELELMRRMRAMNG